MRIPEPRARSLDRHTLDARHRTRSSHSPATNVATITADEVAARVAGIGALNADKLTDWLLTAGLAKRVNGGLAATARGLELGAGIN